MIKFTEKDPSETAFSELVYLINRTNNTKFSDLMRIKLNVNKKTYGNLMMTSGKSISVWWNVRNWLIGLIYNVLLYTMKMGFYLKRPKDVIVPNSKINKVKKFIKDNTWYKKKLKFRFVN